MAGNVDAVTVARAGMPARSVPAAAATASNSDASGKNAAATGQRLPPEPPPAEAAKLGEIVRKLNEMVVERQRSISFHVDEASGRTVITVRHAVTRQVVRQIPSEEVLAVARLFEETGSLVDARI